MTRFWSWLSTWIAGRNKVLEKGELMAAETMTLEVPEELAVQFKEAQQALALADAADVAVSEAEYQLSEAQSNLEFAVSEQLSAHQEANAQAQDVLEVVKTLLKIA